MWIIASTREDGEGAQTCELKKIQSRKSPLYSLSVPWDTLKGTGEKKRGANLDTGRRGEKQTVQHNIWTIAFSSQSMMQIEKWGVGETICSSWVEASYVPSDWKVKLKSVVQILTTQDHKAHLMDDAFPTAPLCSVASAGANQTHLKCLFSGSQTQYPLTDDLQERGYATLRRHRVHIHTLAF